MSKIYALYKGEKLIMIGTIREIAKYKNVKEDTIRYYKTPAHLKKNSKSRLGNYQVLVSLEEED